MVFEIYNYSYWGESKPTNITGGPHIVLFNGGSPSVLVSQVAKWNTAHFLREDHLEDSINLSLCEGNCCGFPKQDRGFRGLWGTEHRIYGLSLDQWSLWVPSVQRSCGLCSSYLGYFSLEPRKTPELDRRFMMLWKLRVSWIAVNRFVHC